MFLKILEAELDRNIFRILSNGPSLYSVDTNKVYSSEFLFSSCGFVNKCLTTCVKHSCANAKKREVMKRGSRKGRGMWEVDHIWHEYILKAEDANEIRSCCHGDLMKHSDGLLQTWPHSRYGRCLAEGAIMRECERAERSRWRKKLGCQFNPQYIASAWPMLKWRCLSQWPVSDRKAHR